MKKLYCTNCKDYKENFIYANPYNSTKFCPDCKDAMEMREYEEPEEVEDPNAWIAKALHNAVNKMFKEG